MYYRTTHCIWQDSSFPMYNIRRQSRDGCVCKYSAHGAHAYFHVSHWSATAHPVLLLAHCPGAVWVWEL